MSTTTTPNVLPVAGLVPLIKKNPKQVENTCKNTERKALKRKRDANKSSALNSPIICDPEKYLLYNPPPNTVGWSIVQYLHSLQRNDVTAQPTIWSLVLLNSSVRRKNNLSLLNRKKDKEPSQQHVWHRLSLNHYCVASTSLEFKTQLDSGLPLPVLIFPGSELGILIKAQSIWSGQSFKSLIDEILKDKDALIKIQDHSISSLEEFITTKTCKLVRVQFDLALEDRGCPWNCLEIKDRLPGFKGPKLLENGASL